MTSIPKDSAYAPGETPTLSAMNRAVMRALRMLIHTAMPGVVEKVTPATASLPATVDVRPGFQAVYWDDEGKESPRPLPVVPRALLFQPSGGGLGVSLPVQKGDHGWLIFAERSLERWLSSGGKPVDPGFAHTHNLTDAIFLPGGAPGPGSPSYDASDLVISTQTGSGVEPAEIRVTPTGSKVTVKASATVEVDAASVKVGSAATSPITKAPELIAAMDAAIAAALANTATPLTAWTAFQTSWNAAKATINATKGKVQ